MSKRVGDVTIIEVEPDMICGECGKVAETRPYGPGGSEICWECGEKMPEIRDHNCDILLFGDEGILR